MGTPTLRDVRDLVCLGEMAHLPAVPVEGGHLHPCALYLAQERQGRELPPGLELHPALPVLRKWARDRGLCWGRQVILGPILDEVRVALDSDPEQAWETPLEQVADILRGRPAPKEPADTRPAQADWPPPWRRIWEALAAGPKTARAIAKQAGYKWSSYVRGVLGDMVTAGVLVKVAAGYARAPLP